MKKRKMKPHWYEITYTECVICGCSDEWRERKFGPKPPPQKRYHFKQYACPEHFI